MRVLEIAPAAALTALLLFGCGNDQPEPTSTPPPEPMAQPAAEPPPESVPVEQQAPAGEPGGPEAEPMDPAEPPPPMGESSSIPADDVRKFSEAQVQLLEIRQGMAQRAQRGEDQAALLREFEAAAPAVIQEAGLTLERYEEIAMRVEQDPELLQQVQQQIEAQL